MVTSALYAAALIAGPVFAQSPTRGNSGTGMVMPASNASVRVVTGTVKEYQAAKWLAVQTNDNRLETFSLDDKEMKVDVDPGVKVGSKVKVTERMENGARSLIVEPASQS